MNHYDVVIIGAGQAALPLARKLADKGRSVAIAERKHLGGSCVNFGCTPTKAVVASARVAHLARRAGEFGISVPAVRADFPNQIKVATFDMKYSGKATEEGETQGFIKLIADIRDKRLLGAAILAVEGGELVASCITLMNSVRTSPGYVMGSTSIRHSARRCRAPWWP